MVSVIVRPAILNRQFKSFKICQQLIQGVVGYVCFNTKPKLHFLLVFTAAPRFLKFRIAWKGLKAISIFPLLNNHISKIIF